MTQIKTAVKREVERESGYFINARDFESDEAELKRDPEYKSLIEISKELNLKL